MLHVCCERPPLRFMHAPSNSSKKHGKIASQIMRKCQNLQTAPSKPYIKKYPTSFKNPGLYRFQGSYEESQLPSRSSLFLGSNPPSNGLKILKKPIYGHNISQNPQKLYKKPTFLKITQCSPLGLGARPQNRVTWLHMAKCWPFGLRASPLVALAPGSVAHCMGSGSYPCVGG
jgi:hypothetical protein